MEIMSITYIKLYYWLKVGHNIVRSIVKKQSGGRCSIVICVRCCGARKWRASNAVHSTHANNQRTLRASRAHASPFGGGVVVKFDFAQMEHLVPSLLSCI